MTKEEIDKLIADGEFPEKTIFRELVETHISWVILCDNFVYKIKKPIQYSFLDFSTLEKRKYFCDRELQLNKRFAGDVYLDVLPVRKAGDRYRIGSDSGIPVDYTVKMRKLDPEKRMDKLLASDNVSVEQIRELAEWTANFHKGARVVKERDVLDLMEKFNALSEEREFVSAALGKKMAEVIDLAIKSFNIFLGENEELLKERLRLGFFRDCHGDLHSRNIFLLPRPQPFDCIEFNDDYREIDVLNEVAFLCMDLDAFGKKALSASCYEYYNSYFPTVRNHAEHQLFTYYKVYRANIRAKVNSLRTKSAADATSRAKGLTETKKYLLLMRDYLVLPPQH